MTRTINAATRLNNSFGIHTCPLYIARFVFQHEEWNNLSYISEIQRGCGDGSPVWPDIVQREKNLRTFITYLLYI